MLIKNYNNSHYLMVGLEYKQGVDLMCFPSFEGDTPCVLARSGNMTDLLNILKYTSNHYPNYSRYIFENGHKYKI